MFRKTIIAAVAAVAAIGVLAPAASATELDADLKAPACTSYLLPNGVGGYNISIAGKTYRVAKYEDIQICAGDSGVFASTAVVQTHSLCGPTCFSVWSPVWTSNPSVTARACYTVDGVRACVGGTTPLPANVNRACFLSVGKPAQHSPSECLVVVDEDNFFALPNE